MSKMTYLHQNYYSCAYIIKKPTTKMKEFLKSLKGAEANMRLKAQPETAKKAFCQPPHLSILV
ncbi:hypothetical protein ONE56_14470 [Vibrio mytili]|uniref:hypothetical protein n=1 Tax=Vibrio mytili TaxID=50718 RepID=UPI003C6F03D2